MRLYTVEDANRTLPYVRAIVRDIRERYLNIRERGHLHNSLPAQEAENRAALKSEIQTQAEQIHACLEELEGIGIELKDYELGLVDFPAELDGRRILLCWKYDEQEVGHWHELEDGYLGRQPVPTTAPGWPGDATAASAARG